MFKYCILTLNVPCVILQLCNVVNLTFRIKAFKSISY